MKGKVIQATFSLGHGDMNTFDCNEYPVTEKGIRKALEDRFGTYDETDYVELAYKVIHTGIYHTPKYRGYELMVGCNYDGDLEKDYGGRCGYVDNTHDITLTKIGWRL